MLRTFSVELVFGVVSSGREPDKALLRSILVGSVCNGFSPREGGEIAPFWFCGEADGDGHLFGSAHSLHLYPWPCAHRSEG